ncbi:hypothetical protein JCM33374_g5586 [Metschnikowia sp. JCM 33374]|nr:hypothetical protein JCM33374_g5586 [Metschnikowia sp. JCM 33374]
MKITVTLITSAILSSWVAAAPLINEEQKSKSANLNPKQMPTMHGQIYPVDYRIFDQGLYMNKRDSEAEWLEAKNKATYYVECFLQDLRAFINDSSFDFQKFESEIAKQRETLANIEFYSETALVDQYHVDTQIYFARYMFQTMVDVTEKMKKYHQSAYPGASLVDKMIELNVRVLALYNASGLPNLSFKGYEKQVLNLYCNFLSLEEDSKKEGNMLSGMQKLYQVSADHAKSSIREFRARTGLKFKGHEECPVV